MPAEADMFLEIVTDKGRIQGEALDSACKGQIDVDSFEVTIKSPAQPEDGEEIGNIELQNAKFTFSTSIASKALFLTLCGNDTIKSVTLSVRKAGGASGKDGVYLQLRFNNARLVSYKISSEDEWSDDEIEIEYECIELCYRQQKSDGSSAPAQAAAYSSASNTIVTATLLGK